MFDTMVITKAVAGLCATFLLFLVGKWAGEAIYMPGHSAEHAAVYPIIEEGDSHAAAAEEPAEQIDVMALYETADAEAGAGLWRNCQSCHKTDGSNGTGPHLDGVVGRLRRPALVAAGIALAAAVVAVGLARVLRGPSAGPTAEA